MIREKLPRLYKYHVSKLGMVGGQDYENRFNTVPRIKMVGLVFASGVTKFMTACKKYCYTVCELQQALSR